MCIVLVLSQSCALSVSRCIWISVCVHCEGVSDFVFAVTDHLCFSAICLCCATRPPCSQRVQGVTVPILCMPPQPLLRSHTSIVQAACMLNGTAPSLSVSLCTCHPLYLQLMCYCATLLVLFCRCVHHDAGMKHGPVRCS